MINKLLVAIHGSHHSLKAVDFASVIAASLEARVITLSVVKAQELPEGRREYARLEHIPGVDVEILKKVAGNMISNAEIKGAGQGR